MTWIELSTTATAEAIDWIRTLLAPLDYIQTIKIQPGLDSGSDSGSNALKNSDSTAKSSFIVHIYLLNDRQARVNVDQIWQLLSPLQRTGLITDMQTAIAADLPTVDVATPLNQVGNFVILPAHANDHSPTATAIPLKIGPHAAFGTGLHPATILSLRLLERYLQPGMHSLDLGCGSGILSVAMAKLGATVTAIDNDPIAVEATQTAIVENQVADRVTVSSGSLGAGCELGHWMGGTLAPENRPLSADASFDLIVANLFARIHLSLIPDYRKALQQNRDRPSLLITAGYDTDYEQDLNQTFAETGFLLVEREQLGNWIALVHQLFETG
ncbi:MAG: 50S ribosomal protein L11 methyltransferase [Leptolyngbyaceae cyanobacterium bins.349]|nr:50S ribosomal protein L11 methyltransferase [Leptolyngbyaceae cyanobacterium bins.349]